MKLSSLTNLNGLVSTLERLRAARTEFRMAGGLHFAACNDRDHYQYIADSQFVSAFRDFLEIEESKLIERIRRLGVEVDA